MLQTDVSATATATAPNDKALVGGSPLANGFRKRRAHRYLQWISSILILVAGMCLVEAYRVLMPFHAVDPFYRQVTINEPVIGDWRYGGQDEEGYLKFFERGGQSIVLPPSARLFDADGQFVVIEHFTPSSLTFAEPLEALPIKWFLAASIVPVGFIVFLLLAYRRRRKKWGAKIRRPSWWFSVPPRQIQLKRWPRFRARTRKYKSWR